MCIISFDLSVVLTLAIGYIAILLCQSKKARKNGCG